MYKQVQFICIFNILIVCTTIHSEFTSTMRSWFGAKPYESIIEKDYTLHNHGSLTLKNIHGNITIKTGLDKKSVAIRAIKRASVQEHLEHMHIIEEEVNTDKLMLRTAYDYEKVKGSIQYVITVPDNTNLHISTDNGNISIMNVCGTIIATTGNGNILLEHPIQKTQATITQQGNISIIQPEGPIYTKINKGALAIRDSMHTVHAHVRQGKIDIKCRLLPEQEQILCDINTGNIMLHAPKHLNCSLIADAPEGTITSEQAICLHEQTTVLNNGYWERIKKQVRGSIGKQDASVTLLAQKGTIKIVG